MDKGDEAINIKDATLIPIWNKVQDGTRLSYEDGVRLFHSDDLLGLGIMANWVKEKKTGNRATFVESSNQSDQHLCSFLPVL